MLALELDVMLLDTVVVAPIPYPSSDDHDGEDGTNDPDGGEEHLGGEGLVDDEG